MNRRRRADASLWVTTYVCVWIGGEASVIQSVDDWSRTSVGLDSKPNVIGATTTISSLTNVCECMRVCGRVSLCTIDAAKSDARKDKMDEGKREEKRYSRWSNGGSITVRGKYNRSFVWRFASSMRHSMTESIYLLSLYPIGLSSHHCYHVHDSLLC